MPPVSIAGGLLCYAYRCRNGAASRARRQSPRQHAEELLAQTAELESMARRVGKIERSLSVGLVGSFINSA